MVKTTPPIRWGVRHQASTTASGCWQASIGNPIKRECLQYIKRPGGYVQLHNSGIDQGQRNTTIRAVPINCALNTTLQQRSRTQVPVIFTGARPTLCHNKKKGSTASRSGSQVAEQTHIRYKREAQQCPKAYLTCLRRTPTQLQVSRNFSGQRRIHRELRKQRFKTMTSQRHSDAMGP
jgi:hypothetical protein